jgi:hypothetical protein
VLPAQPAPQPTSPEAEEEGGQGIGTLTPHEVVEPPEAENAPPTSTLRPVRTFRDDLEQTMQQQSTSVVDVASAEETKKNKTTKRATPKSSGPGMGTIIKVALIFLFTGMTLVTGFFLLSFTFDQPENVPVDTIPEHIFAEENEEVDVTGLSREQLIQTLEREMAGVDVRRGAIANLYLVEKETLEDGAVRTRLLTTEEVLTTLSDSIPFDLTEFLEDVPMFGVHVEREPAPFFIFKTVHYGNVFSGMVKWEETMQQDLAPLFGEAVSPGTLRRSEVGTTSATTTDAAPPELGLFADEVIANKDARVLRGPRGQLLLLHAFINPTTIVITTNEETFTQIVERASTRRF